jgi:DNA topoisomerase-3
MPRFIRGLYFLSPFDKSVDIWYNEGVKTLVIAEKPSVALDIVKALSSISGDFIRKDGYFEGSRFVVSHALGHIVRLYMPEEYDESLKTWRLDNLPIVPSQFKYKAMDKQFAVLKKLIQREDIDTIVNACDAGREGELIFRQILLLTGVKGKTIKRLWLSAMTKEEILKEFKNLRDASEFDNLGKASFVREQADWLVGINATRAFSVKFNKNLSIGRVQTPTLNMLVEREQEIRSFVPKKYYELQLTFAKENFKYDALLEYNGKSQFDERKSLDWILQRVQGRNGIIKDLNVIKDKTVPPLLYDLTELQRDANKTYGFSAQKTLDLAQSLYEKRKVLSYPRTDSRYLPSSLKSNIPKIINAITFAPYNVFAKQILQKGITFTSRIINDAKVSDHYALIPTGHFEQINELTDDERKVFDLVMRRFLAVFMDPSETYKSTIITEDNGYTFKTNISVLTYPGWQAVYEKKAESVPKLSIGDTVKYVDGKVLEKETQPPQRFTDATLLTAMENAGKIVEDEELREAMKEKGIGTPATRAQIIERLIQVGYVERKGKMLIPTEKGMSLIPVVKNVGVETLLSPELTGEWEYKLRLIEKGNYLDTKFKEDIVGFVKQVVDKTRGYTGTETVVDRKDNPVGKCPVCGADVYENAKAYHCSKCNFVLWKTIKGKSITRTRAEKLLQGKVVSIGEVKAASGKTFDGRIKLNKDGGIEFVFDKK